MNGWVYILKLKNGKYYVGSTSDLERRIQQHQNGLSGYTKNFLPLTLVFAQKYVFYSQARRAELWFKKNKDRRVIEKIVKDKVLKKLF